MLGKQSKTKQKNPCLGDLILIEMRWDISIKGGHAIEL